MSTEFISPNWRMLRNANQDKSANYSLDFDGAATTSINVGNMTAIQGASTFSIAAWINLDSTGAKRIFGSWQSSANWRIAGFGIYNDNKLLLQISGNGNAFDQLFSTSTITTINTWTHVAVTFSSGTAEFYIDGASAGTDTSTTVTSIYDISNDYFIGSFQSSTTLAFDGKMDQVCVFDYVLSPNQITTLWGGGTSASNPMALPRTPIAYYPLGTSAWNGNFLAENNAIGDYVFKTLNTTQSFTSNINQSNTGNKFTVSLWAKNNGVYRFWFDHGATNEGGFQNIGSQLIVYLANNFYQYFTLPSPDLTTDGNWHHYVIYVDSNDVTNSEIWIDKNSLTKASSVSSGSALAFTSGFKLTPRLAEVSNMMYFINYEIDQANVDKLYNYGSPLMSTATLTQAPNAWYKLDASEIYNSSSTEWSVDNNTYPSTYTSSLKFVASELDRIDMPYDTILNPSSNYTFSIWFNPTSINSNSSLFGSSILNRGVNMYYPPNNTKVTFYHKTSTANENFDIVFPDSPVDTWNNVTVTWSASTGIIRAFINGKYISQKENISDIVWGGTLKVSQYTSYGWYFDGQLSNLAMWDVTLTDGFSGTPTNGDVASGQVAEVYNNGQPQASITGSPVGWWKLNNGGKFITDSSGNNFTATNHSGNFQTGGAIEYAGFVNTLAGESLGMNQSNLVQSDLQTVAPFSKYALNFDAIDLDRIDTGVKLFNDMTSFTASIWAKGWSTSTLSVLMSQYDGGNNPGPFILTARHNNNTNGFTAWIDIGGTFYTSHNDIGFSDNTKWINLVATWDGSNIILYINGIAGQTTSASGTIRNTTLYNFFIGGYPVGINSNSYDGELSNCSVWNTALSAAQVREVYNEGLPSDLNTFSGTAPVAWWKLGEGVSYDGTSLIVQDYKGNNHGTSYSSMDQTDIVNGVGTSLNGASSGFNAPSSTVTNIVSDAPYSDKNAVSVNMQSAKPGSGIDTSTPQAT